MIDRARDDERRVVRRVPFAIVARDIGDRRAGYVGAVAQRRPAFGLTRKGRRAHPREQIVERRALIAVDLVENRITFDRPIGCAQCRMLHAIRFDEECDVDLVGGHLEVELGVVVGRLAVHLGAKARGDVVETARLMKSRVFRERACVRGRARGRSCRSSLAASRSHTKPQFERRVPRDPRRRRLVGRSAASS